MLNLHVNSQLAISQKTQNPFLKIKARHLIIWFIFITIGVSFAYTPLADWLGIKGYDPIMTYLIYCLVFGLTSLWLLIRFYQLRVNPSQLFRKPPRGYRWLRLFGFVCLKLFFSLGSALLAFYLLNLIAPSFLESWLNSIRKDDQVSALPSLYTSLKFFAFVIVAPVTEEWLFRGLLLNRWATKWNIHISIILSSVLFGLLHPHPLGISVVAIILSLLYLKTRTLIVPIVAHSMNNAIAFGLMLLSDLGISPLQHISLLRWQLGLLFVLISAPIIIWFIVKNWPRNKHSTLPF